MDPRTKDALLWGAVGLFAFLVLLQAYELLADVRVAVGVKAGVALVVGVGAAGASYAARGRLGTLEPP